MSANRTHRDSASVRRQRALNRAVVDALEGRTMFSAPGDLDLSFDLDGKVFGDFAGGQGTDYRSIVVDTAITKDGKILALGHTTAPGGRNGYVLARYNANGSLDATFGTGGSIKGTGFTPGAVTLQSDGKVVVAGSAPGTDAWNDPDFAVLRFHANGAVDTSFDEDGRVQIDLAEEFVPDGASEVVVQSDGKILAVGSTGRAGQEDVALLRLNADGSRDLPFGNFGVVVHDLGAREGAADVQIVSGGKIVIAGTTGRFSESSLFGDNQVFVARYNVDGKRDDTFGDGGDGSTVFEIAVGRDEETGMDYRDYASALAVDAQGRLIVGAQIERPRTEEGADAAMARFLADGRVDTSFAAEGRFITHLGHDAEGIHDVAVQDGKIVAAGFAGEDFLVLRLDEAGKFDPTFGPKGAGWVGVDMGGALDRAYSLEVHDGKILLAGANHSAGNLTASFALARLHGGESQQPPPDNFTYTIVNGLLTVTGTDNADQFRLFADNAAGTLTIANGRTARVVSTKLFSRLLVDAKGGNDAVVLENGVIGATVVGGAGNDTLTGGAGNDNLVGGDGADQLRGGAGHDKLDGQAGNDSLYGADGSDTLLGGDGHDALHGENGNDTLDGGLGNDQLVGGANFDAVDYRGRFANLVIRLDTLANDGQAGELDNVVSDVEQILSGSGHDLIVGDARGTQVFGGAGNDTVRAGGGNDSVYGGLGADVLQGDDGDDLLDGQDGNDTAYGNAGRDDLRGGAGNDNLDGGIDNDRLDGQAGNDTVRGHLGDDVLIGGTGTDWLYGLDGNDTLYARDNERDYVDGGNGFDKAQVDGPLDARLNLESLLA